MTEIFLSTGQLTELEFDTLKIVKGIEQISRNRFPNDQRVEHQQRALLLTAKCSVER